MVIVLVDHVSVHSHARLRNCIMDFGEYRESTSVVRAVQYWFVF
jgi:hypothetical protein